ncbi:response regulator [Myxosarcina sp. GI1]|uniref:response regulator n=1 Tax=Myxosarcina sp. GI1 TaxID=1541065 RepID=UPI00055BE1AB|nr:response regulator [Myxosarcina sp. GI1]
MITDPSIRDQAYQYFLEEAPELLQTIEEELLAINDELSDLNERPRRVNKLMRATHTLKGGAANVGLETIKTVAHSMEDVFKALYNKELVIDNETRKLLYESLDCLRIPLTAEFSQAPIDRDEILDRTATVFTELQDKFGDYLSDQDAFPTSEELGLDVVESFFQAVIPERIQELSVALASNDNKEIAETLRSQAEIFLGLAESLNLLGLAEISQTIITAIDTNPHQAAAITEAAIANLELAQKQVMEGDRERGGEPIPELQKFVSTLDASAIDESEAISTVEVEESESLSGIWGIGAEAESTETAEAITTEADEEKDTESLSGIWSIGAEDESTETAEAITTEADEEKDTESLSGIWSIGAEDESTETAEAITAEADEEDTEFLSGIWGIGAEDESTETAEATTIENQEEDSDLSQIWGMSEEVTEVTTNETRKDSTKEDSERAAEKAIVPSEVSVPAVAENSQISKSKTANRYGSFSSPGHQKPKQQPAVNQTVRVNLESLERLNDLVGELLIDRNKSVLKDEQIHYLVRELINKINHNEKVIEQLIGLIDEAQLSSHQKEILKDLPEKLQLLTDASNIEERKNINISKVENQNDLSKLLESAQTSNYEIIDLAEKIKTHNKQAKLDAQKQQRMLLNMRDELIETRMSPVGRLFNRFPRLLQQLSITHSKKTELSISGSHILIDKTIEEKLYDPLLHLVRNSFDHGLESNEHRVQMGKPETGTIFLRAYYQGSQTIIEVGDDGGGINIEKIKQKGIDKKLITPQEANSLSPSQLLEILFEPGFSTADKLSDLSGRGVGLDVVRSQIEAMNGTISIESIPQQGTTFALQIPLTLTIAKLMLTKAAGMTYALLIDAIERIVIPNNSQVQMFEGQKVLHWHTESGTDMIPVRQLSSLIEYPRTIAQRKPSESRLDNPILLLRRQGGLIGLEVDEVLGEQELVIRPLGSAIIPPSYIYGCSVLKDSSLTLVIDGAALLRDAQSKKDLVTQKAFLADVNFQALPGNSETPQLLPEASSLAKTLLVVDDSSSLRKTIAMSLEKISQEVIQADNGINALSKLQKSSEVELIVCDLEMPLMNGFQFLQALSQNSNLKDIPVIILTSRDSEKHRKLALQLGAVAYLVKPCAEPELFATINNILAQKSK